MIPKSCKRLAEVDFPIAVVSKHAAYEKFVSHGQLITAGTPSRVRLIPLGN